MNASASPQASFSLSRILVIVIPVGLILLGVVGYIRFGDELGLTGSRIPQIVTVENYSVHPPQLAAPAHAASIPGSAGSHIHRVLLPRIACVSSRR